MKKHLMGLLNKLIQIFIAILLSVSLDSLIAVFTNDDSIWLGESINIVAAVLFGPVVGGLSTFISSTIVDYLIYNSFEYFFEEISVAVSVALIGIIYRRLNKGNDKFGIREIVVFNFVQILINTIVIYLSTPPLAVMLFDSFFDGRNRTELLTAMSTLASNTFSECISIALIGTVLLSICFAIRKKFREYHSIGAVFHSILKPNYINKEYRTRALEYTVGIFFAIALTMVDGVISGHVLGPDALASTSLMFPLVSLSTFLSNIITSGCSNLCAIAKGDGDYEKARRFFTLGFFATVFIGLMQSALFFLIRDFYFGYFTTTPEIGAFAAEYYNYYIFVPPFMALAIFLDEMTTSDGDDMLSYGGYLCSFGVNVGLSLALSRVMGMGGLAFATMFSYVAYLMVVSLHFLKKSNTYRFRLYFSFRDLISFAKRSLKTNASGLCMFAVSSAFTKAILMLLGSDYLIANTVLCAMLEIYEMVNGPSEAAEYLFATYLGERNSEGIKILFKEALMFCLVGGIALALFLLIRPDTVLLLYGIEDSPLGPELIPCIRFCAVGIIAAAAGGFLSDYYGNTGKPLWSCMMVAFRVALFPILFCVTFCVQGGPVGMGRGMLLSQIAAVVIFYGFVLIVKGSESIPYMLDEPEYEKVHMNSFDYKPEEYERISGWIRDNLERQGIEDKRIEKSKELFLSLCKKIEEKGGKKKVLGECVIRFIEKPEIIIKDNGELFKPDIEDERLSYSVLMSCNSNTISV